MFPPPDDALPFAKDRQPEYPEVEDRKHLAPKQKAELVLKQGGRCMGCGIKPRHGFEYDHVTELWESGTNAIDNWQALGSRKDCDCHKTKTAAAAKRRAKMNRLRGKAGQLKRRRENGPQIVSRGILQSAGFRRDPKMVRGVDGKVRERNGK